MDIVRPVVCMLLLSIACSVVVGPPHKKTVYECDLQTQFSCGGRSCISLNLVCDGKSDCSEGEDEHWDECKRNGCLLNNGGCSHSCVNTFDGFHCKCMPGYKLMEDGKHCIDIDECENPGICSQNCYNDEGSFKCDCEVGYLRDPQDPTRCMAPKGSTSLLFVGNNEISTFSLDLHKITAVINDTKLTNAFDFVFRSGMVYWNNFAEKEIYKAPINDSKKRTVVIKEDWLTSILSDLAVDWIYNHIYWSNQVKHTIEVTNFDGNIRKALIKDRLQIPVALAVNPLEGWLFWANCDHWSEDNTKIERAGLDGSLRETIVSKEIGWPISLTLDLVRRRVYWLDSMRHSISSCDYNGAARREIIQLSTTFRHPSSISVFEDILYWTDLFHGVYKANKFNGSNVMPLTANRMMDNPISLLRVYHPYKQPYGVNYCATSHVQCSHLCLPAPQINSSSPRISCACPDGLALMADGLTCTRSNHKN